MLDFGEPEDRKLVAINSAIGLLYVFVNFPVLLERTASRLVGDGRICTALLTPVNLTQGLMAALIGAIGPSPQSVLQILISCSFVGLLLYLLALIVFTIRHRDAALLGLGGGGLILGVAALQAISWIALAVLWVSRTLLRVLTFIFDLLLIVITFLLRYTWWLLLLLVAIYLIYRFREHLLKATAIVAIPVGIALILLPFLPRVWRWIVKIVTFIGELLAMILDRYIVPILLFLFSIVRFIFYALVAVLGVIAALNALGHLVVDQIKAAWHAGDGRKGVQLAAFGIGSAFALLVLVCIANPQLDAAVQGGWTLGWQRLDNLLGTSLSTSRVANAPITRLFVITMPRVVRGFVFENLTDADAPIFDALLLLAILIISYVGILRRTVERLSYYPTSVPVTFYPHEYIEVFGGLVAAVALIFMQAWSEGDR